jgi:uncharacterized protein YjbI with pentapeptide repeats
MKAKWVAVVVGLVGFGMPAVGQAAGTRDCSDRPLVPGANLRRCDLRPLQLATLDVHGADMRRATLAGMILGGGADGPRTNFKGVLLDRADLTGVVFGDNDLSGASFRYAQMRRTDYEDVTLANADLYRADLRGASFTNGGIAGADFERADLRGARLTRTDASDPGLQTSFRRADLTGADLSDADFSGATFERANLTGANLAEAVLTSARFRRAILSRVIWSNTTCPDGTNSDTNGGTCIGHLLT